MPREEKTLVMLHVPLTVQLSDVAMVHVVSAARAASDDVTTNTVSQRPRHNEESVSTHIIIIFTNSNNSNSNKLPLPSLQRHTDVYTHHNETHTVRAN